LDSSGIYSRIQEIPEGKKKKKKNITSIISRIYSPCSFISTIVLHPLCNDKNINMV